MKHGDPRCILLKLYTGNAPLNLILDMLVEASTCCRFNSPEQR